MTVPNGYNTVPHFRYFEDIAAGIGSSGTTYYVDTTAGDDTNDGLSWEYALRKRTLHSRQRRYHNCVAWSR